MPTTIQVISSLEGLNVDAEIILVDDGSSDGSAQKIKDLAFKYQFIKPRWHFD